MYEPIAYTYEADHHCPDCTEKRFGLVNGHIPDDAEDNEGYPVGVIAPWDEWWSSDDECETLNCGDCHAELADAHIDGCEGMASCSLSHQHGLASWSHHHGENGDNYHDHKPR